MHRLTQLKAKWNPTVVQTHPGVSSSNPQLLLRREGEELAKFWHASHVPPEVCVPDRVHLPRPSAAELRNASS
eukprot:7505652-Pyramimonas_sp.AAC.1